MRAQALRATALLELDLLADDRCCSAQPPHTPKCSARGCDAIRRRLEDALEPAFIEIAAALEPPPFDAFAGQRVVDEHGLAVDVRDAATVVRQVDDRRRVSIRRDGA